MKVRGGLPHENVGRRYHRGDEQGETVGQGLAEDGPLGAGPGDVHCRREEGREESDGSQVPRVGRRGDEGDAVEAVVAGELEGEEEEGRVGDKDPGVGHGEGEAAL